MGIEVVPAEDEAGRRQFIRLPWRIYRDDPHWVPPLLRDEAKRLDPEKNPLFDHADVKLYLAREDGEPVGRISAHIDHLHNEFHGERTGLFGFFECAENQRAARALLDRSSEWLRGQGMERIRGPFNFNTNGESGMLIQGLATQPTLLMPYNPGYYPQLMEACGLSKAKDLHAYEIHMDEAFRAHVAQMEPKLEKISRRAREQGYTVRPVNLRDFDAEVDRLMEVYNEAWERNWGFVPLTEREFKAESEELKRILVPELAVFVEHGEEPAGFGLAVPDFNQALKPLNGRLFPLGIFKLLWHTRKIDGLRLLILGIKRKHRVRGVDALLYLTMVRAGLSMRRFRWCECSWVLEDNHRMISFMKRIRAQLTKVYRVYEREL